MRILIPTRWLKRRKPIDEPTPPGVPNTVLWGDYVVPFVPKQETEAPEKRDPMWYMRPRLPMGVPWTFETAQWLDEEIAEWEARYAKGG